MTEPGAGAAVLVTVVVPTRNVERTIDACLASVKAQDHPAVELIVVDNDSTDRTPEIARRWADRFESAGPERSAQRNLGYSLASGAWVAWIDSDMVLPADFVSDCLHVAARDSAEAVSIPERSIARATGRPAVRSSAAATSTTPRCSTRASSGGGCWSSSGDSTCDVRAGGRPSAPRPSRKRGPGRHGDARSSTTRASSTCAPS